MTLVVQREEAVETVGRVTVVISLYINAKKSVRLQSLLVGRV